MDDGDISNLMHMPEFIIDDKIKNFTKNLEDKIQEVRNAESGSNTPDEIQKLHRERDMIQNQVDMWMRAKKIKSKGEP